jgi:hypothetical protein
MDSRAAKHIGIVAVSAEGAALCYRTICTEGAGVFFNRSDSPALYEMTVPREHDLFTSQIYGFTNECGPLAADPARALLQMSRFRPDAWRTTLPMEELAAIFKER